MASMDIDQGHLQDGELSDSSGSESEIQPEQSHQPKGEEKKSSLPKKRSRTKAPDLPPMFTEQVLNELTDELTDQVCQTIWNLQEQEKHYVGIQVPFPTQLAKIGRLVQERFKNDPNAKQCTFSNSTLVIQWKKATGLRFTWNLPQNWIRQFNPFS